MKKGGGKAKGGSYEREISELLSLWFSEGERDDIFYRSHSSGARFTARGKNKKDTAYQSGDITCSDPIGEPLIKNWSIECKTGYGSWDVLDIIDSKQKQTVLEKHWEQCETDAAKSNKHPVLIFRRSRKASCICLPGLLYYELMDVFNAPKFTTIKVSIEDDIYIMHLEDFFMWIPNIHSYLAGKKK
jgi:hypothetical protein